MTVEEMVINLYEGSYEQDELVPYNALGTIDDTIVGFTKLVGFINRAIKVVSTWKFPNGVRIQFKANNGLAFVSTPETGYAESLADLDGAASIAAGFQLPVNSIVAGEPRQIILPVAMSRRDGFYNNAVIVLRDGTSHFILNSFGEYLALETNVDPTYDNYPFRIHQTNFTIGSNPALHEFHLPEFISIQDIYDKTNSAELSRNTSQSFLDGAEKNIGTPSIYTVFGDRIYFDSALQQATTYRIRYWKYARSVNLLSDSFDLPEAFHEAIYLCAKAELLRRIGEATESYAAWRSLEATMITLRNEADFEHENARARVYPEE